MDEIQPDVDTNFGYRDTQPAIEMGIPVFAVTSSYFLYLALLCYVFSFYFTSHSLLAWMTPACVLDYTHVISTPLVE